MTICRVVGPNYCNELLSAMELYGRRDGTCTGRAPEVVFGQSAGGNNYRSLVDWCRTIECLQLLQLK